MGRKNPGRALMTLTTHSANLLMRTGSLESGTNHRSDRKEVYPVDRYRIVPSGRQDALLALRLRMRDETGGFRGRPEAGRVAQLRLPDARAGQRTIWHASHDTTSGSSHLDTHEKSLLGPKQHRMASLRWPRDRGMRPLAVLRELLGGYGANLVRGRHHRPDRCEWRLHTGELSLGQPIRTGRQSAIGAHHQHTKGTNERNRGGAIIRYSPQHYFRSPSLRMA